ncbi:MAG: MBOAT family protein [Ruminococcaceae bacterium]|nr:MBOAT family protein [Oscillospiraceae bacterium]
MNFNSPQFLLFYPIVAVLNFIVPRKYRWIPLLIASYYFYMTWNAALVFLILFTTAVSYFSGILIEKKPEMKKLWMILSVTASLAVLFFFKYYNFFAGTIGDLAGTDLTLRLVLPVGISFYTFQTLSYSIDVYRGDIKAEHNFFYYALFVSFFPQLVAGPIERPGNLLPQLYEEHKFNTSDLSIGAKRMLAGFFKKIVVADTAAVYVNAVYNNAGETGGLAIIIATVLFAVQIYCDFSGYTDIAIGCARIMGYRLMQNFDRPYSAENIRDFWARWHISLSSWFKDYLYIPLGGNRKGNGRRLLNLFIVFLVSGLWHGAEWTFLLWGLLHGIYRIVGELTYQKRNALYGKLGLDTASKPVRAFRTAITFVLVCFAWIFFRANNTSELLLILGKLFTDFGAGTFAAELGLTPNGALIVVLAIAVMILMDRRLTLTEYASPTGAKLTGGVSLYMIWAIAFAWLILLAGDGSSAFIYFQF